MRRTYRTPHVVTAAVLGLAVVAFTVYAAVNTTIATGVMDHSDAVRGPATVHMRTLEILSGEILGWHYHPGVGAYTIVKTGTLTVEDGCGGETVYYQGQAFLEPPGRVHRGKNLTNSSVVTAQTFIVPEGSPTSVSTGQLCGPPAATSDCQGSAWMNFTHPRTFSNQGDCVQFVKTGR